VSADRAHYFFVLRSDPSRPGIPSFHRDYLMCYSIRRQSLVNFSSEVRRHCKMRVFRKMEVRIKGSGGSHPPKGPKHDYQHKYKSAHNHHRDIVGRRHLRLEGWRDRDRRGVGGQWFGRLNERGLSYRITRNISGLSSWQHPH
jgi:hypothetical protein